MTFNFSVPVFSLPVSIFASEIINIWRMINLTLNSIQKGSQILEIEAAVLRSMEKVNFRPKEINTELTEAKEEGFLVMVFVVEETTVEQLSRLQHELGNNFKLGLLGKSKTDLFLKVEAPREEFVRLGRSLKPLAPAQTGTTPSQPANKNY